MKPGWVTGIVMLYVVLQMVCNICELTTPLTSGDTSHLQALMNPEIPSYSNPIGAVGAYVSVPFIWIWHFLNILFFNFSFFTGSWVYFKYIFFWPISIGAIYGLISWLRGNA